MKKFFIKLIIALISIFLVFGESYIDKEEGLIPLLFPLNNKVLTLNATMTKEDEENLVVPIKGTITSYYNTRIHPVFKVKRKHNGMDISGVWHDKVKVIKEGKVIEAGVDEGYGNHILIKHGDNFYSFYAHLSKIKVKEKENVTAGQIIALEGGDPYRDKNHGISTGHHLHFEIRTSTNVEDSVDPLLFFEEKDFNK